jgi:molybdopterin molybdotransferase
MVTVNEAKQLIIANSQLLEKQKCALDEALGRVLAEDVIAPISLPPFRQSSMDGYAIIHTDITQKGTPLTIMRSYILISPRRAHH